jgi:hypothetical protein
LSRTCVCKISDLVSCMSPVNSRTVMPSGANLEGKVVYKNRRIQNFVTEGRFKMTICPKVKGTNRKY